MNPSISVAIKYGLFSTIALIVYFLILKLIGLHNNPWFRILNGVFIAGGIYTAILKFKTQNFNSFSYTNGFKIGLVTGFIATILFAFFMAIYMFHIDVEFMNGLLKNWFSNDSYGGGLLIAIIIIEGLASTVVLTLTFMQLFKKSRNIPQNS